MKAIDGFTLGLVESWILGMKDGILVGAVDGSKLGLLDALIVGVVLGTETNDGLNDEVILGI